MANGGGYLPDDRILDDVVEERNNLRKELKKSIPISELEKVMWCYEDLLSLIYKWSKKE